MPLFSQTREASVHRSVHRRGQANGYALSDPGSRFVAYAAAGPNLILNVPTPPSGHQWSYCFINPQSGICSDKVLRLLWRFRAEGAGSVFPRYDFLSYRLADSGE